jgi:GTP cyclohydrolase I
MKGDLLATACGNQVHTVPTCPRWCDAAYTTTDQGGSPHPAPVVANGANSVEWSRISLIGGKGHGKQAFVQPVHLGTDAKALDRTLETRRAEDGVRALLRLMGEDPDRDGIRDTPARVVKAYLEMASRPGDPVQLLSRTFGDVGQGSEMICVPGIEFVSLCEHHLLPFTGTATVAYIPQPSGSVVGLSKIPRLVHHWAMRPQVQERLTRQIADSLESGLTVDGALPLGVAVRIESAHMCMSLRGVKAQGAAMVTTDLRGRFLENDATRAEFMAEARG